MDRAGSGAKAAHATITDQVDAYSGHDSKSHLRKGPPLPSSVVTTSCRLTVLSSTTRVDLVVPADVPVADLLTNLVAGLGAQTADQGIASGGWVLQRLGDAPLDPARTLAMQGVTDGSVFHLLPRSQQLPEVAYDDVLDAVGAGVREETSRWTVRHARLAYLGAGAAGLIWGLVATLLSGPDWAIPTAVLATTAVLLLMGAAAFARVPDSGRGAALSGRGAVLSGRGAVLSGTAAILFAAAAGASALGRHRVWDFGAAQLLPAAGAAILAATLAMVVTGTGIPIFIAVLGAGALAAIGTAVSTLSDLSVHGSAALTAIAALAVSPFLPVASFRLSRLALPAIPTGAEDLRGDNAVIDGRTVLGQAARADEYLTGLTAAIALTLAGSCVVLVGGGSDTSARVLVGVLGAICLLRARLFTGLGQRSALIVAGLVAMFALLVAIAVGLDPTTRLLACVVPALVVSLVLLSFAATMPGRRLAPTWGRSADLLESLLVLAVIPLAVGVLGIYGAMRGLSSV